MKRSITENEIATIVLDGCFEVHRELGPGLLESIYEKSLILELTNKGLQVERQKVIDVTYKGVPLGCGYRVDLLVENRLVVELKAVESITDLFIAQTLTYLKLTGCRLGLIINFNSPRLKDGIKRVINGQLS